ncbi:MAG: regulatory protein RecX [Legionellaceae bacterium]|nr:regulatory protein RecX [Legionellaceae bacterium]
MPEGFDVAVRLLARREHSAQQLRMKLKQRNFTADIIDEVLEDCVRLNVQSDRRFAEMFCRSRIQRGYGPIVIRQLLRQTGVSVDIIDDVLQDAESEITWGDEVARVWHKKFQAVEDVSIQARQKQRQFLKYRGFTETTIGAFFKALEVDNENV